MTFRSSAIPHAQRRSCLASIVVVVMVAVAGCASPRHRAPVEQRTGTAPPAVTVSQAPAVVPNAVEPTKPPTTAGNAGKPGYYTVRVGDTMNRIAADNGQSVRDIAKWNNLDNPNLIEVGQVLRVVPPDIDASAVASRGVAGSKLEPRPLDAKAPAAPAAAATAVPPGTPVAAAAPAAPPAEPKPAAPKTGDDDVDWMWPANGSVVASFDEVRNKGLAIAGKAGDPVYAAADGRVVYAGSGLRGYGNLVIVKHNNTYLTAYAHNQSLLVKEDQVVRRGQKIAEMGSSDADRVQLHFEIRRQGKPIDPAKLLPSR
jgi:lipoprotein NlpD